MCVNKFLPLPLFLLLIPLWGWGLQPEEKIDHRSYHIVVEELKAQAAQAVGVTRVDLLNEIAKNLIRKGEFKKSAEFSLKARKEAQKIKYPIGEINAINHLSVYRSFTKSKMGRSLAQDALNLSRQIGYQPGEGWAFNALGFYHGKFFQYKKALKSYQAALEIFQKLNYPIASAYIHNNIGWVHHYLSQHQLAMESYNRALQINLELRNLKRLGVNYHNLGWVYKNLSQNQKALNSFEKAAEYNKKTANTSLLAKNYNSIGLIYYALSNYSRAFEYQQKALALNLQTGNLDQQAHNYANMGNIYFILSQFEKCLEVQRKALNINKKTGSRYNQAVNYAAIGSVYIALEQYDKALDFLKKAKKINLETGNKHWLANNEYKIGTIYESQAKFEEAERYFKQALNLNIEIENRRGQSLNLTGLGRVSSKKSNHPLALEYFEKSLKITGDIGNKNQEGRNYCGMANVLIKLNRLREAENILNKSERIFKQIDVKINLRDCYIAFITVYELSKQWEKYVHYDKLLHKLDGEIKLEEQAKRITLGEQNIAIIQTERQLKLLKQGKELAEKEKILAEQYALMQRLKSQREKTARKAITVILILVVIILFLLFRKYINLFSFWKKQKLLGKYQLIEKIASGGMGSVYKAKMRGSRKPVALKVMTEEFGAEPEVKQRFNYESAIMEKFQHPNIVRFLERGEVEGRLYIAMEYLDGISLRKKISISEQLPLEVCIRMMSQMAEGIFEIHEKNILHRDIKPDNIMVIDSPVETIKLLDFGVARGEAQTRLTMTGEVVGTLDYVAPELFCGGKFSKASDIYSLGVTFFELLTNSKLYSENTATEIIDQKINHPSPRVEDFRKKIPAQLGEMLRGMLHRDPERRMGLEEVMNMLNSAPES